MNTSRFLHRRFVGMFFGYAAKPFDQPSLVAGLSRLLASSQFSHPRVLHVEDDQQDHPVVSSLVGGRLDFERVTSLREAHARVALERFDAMGGKSGPLANEGEAT